MCVWFKLKVVIMNNKILKKINILSFLVIVYLSIFFEQTQAAEFSGKIYTALSIDGGGIRGLIPIKTLERIEKNTGEPICKLFDYIGGTSTGGLLTLGLTVPKMNNVENRPRYTAKELTAIFESEERFQIFPFSWSSTIKTLGSYLGSLYSTENYEDILGKRLGNHYLSGALTNILVTATEFETKNMTVFCKEGKDIGERIIEGNILMREVARATSAAPSYFKAGRVVEPTGGNDEYKVNYYVDGGVCCNNPTQLVWNRLQRKFDAVTSKNVYLLSLGTGTPDTKNIGKPTPNSSVSAWLPHVTGYFMDGNSLAVHNEMENLLGDNYKRVQPILKTAIDLAGVDDKNIENLKKAADLVSDREINEICEQLRLAGKWGSLQEPAKLRLCSGGYKHPVD